MALVTGRVVGSGQANVSVLLLSESVSVRMTLTTLKEEGHESVMTIDIPEVTYDRLSEDCKTILRAIEPDSVGSSCFAVITKDDAKTLTTCLRNAGHPATVIRRPKLLPVDSSPEVAVPSTIPSEPVQAEQAIQPTIEDQKPSEGFVGDAMAIPTPIPAPMSQQEQQYREIAGQVLSGNRHNLYATQRVDMGSARTIDPEVHVRRMREVLEACKEECVVLSYDIPDTVKDQCPNPSSWLWRYGFRFNLSVWMVPLKTINDQDSQVSQAIRHWQSHGVRVRWVRQHPDEARKIQEYAIEDLRIQLVEWHTSLIRTIEGADKKLREELDKLPPESTERDELRLHQQRDSAIRGCIKKASDNLDSALKCAEIFDMTEDVDDLVRALRFARESALQSFNADAIRRGVKRAI